MASANFYGKRATESVIICWLFVWREISTACKTQQRLIIKRTNHIVKKARAFSAEKHTCSPRDWVKIRLLIGSKNGATLLLLTSQRHPWESAREYLVDGLWLVKEKGATYCWFTKSFFVQDEWMTCQRNWLYLESIFSAPDIQRQLPAEAKMFLTVDKSWKEVMRKVHRLPNALRAATQPG